MQTLKHQLVIVGGGAGGLSVANGLLKQNPRLDIAIIEPSEYHYYQPAWTLVGGGAFDIEDTRREQSRFIPKQSHWIRQRAERFEPENNAVVLTDGTRVEYQYLLVAVGIQIDWHKVDGLEAALGKNGVTSNYRYDLAPYTWECVRQFKGGDALFTFPATPIKCPGAPQKILYLAADHFRRNGVSAQLSYLTAGAAIFGVPFYAKALDKVVAHYGATMQTAHNLIAVDGAAKQATFEVGAEKKHVTRRFDLLHVAPPQSAPNCLKNSTLSNEGGWVDVDKNSLRHVKYPNVFAIGDCIAPPCSKTAAAARGQARIVIANLDAAIQGREASASYDGYASCPLTTSNGKVLLAEFSYGGAVAPSFPLDPRVPRRSYWWLKKHYLPYLYWNMLSGDLGPDWHNARSYPEAIPDITP